MTNCLTELVWNEVRSLVEGVIDTEGEYTYMVHVQQGDESSDVEVHLTVSSELQQPVPFMGWLSWNVVQLEISESVIRTVADAMVSQGLADAGYNYLVIDDLWHASYRQSGTNKPLPNATKFPNGMKVCADYVHDKGLKFGIYSDAANKTCAGAFGSYGYETIDANQYAEWGVDLLKYDYCYAPSDVAPAKERYKTMGDALKASGCNILFYMCEWGVREPWRWATETGATCWRATYDTRDGWNGKDGGIGIVESVAGMKDLWPYHGVNRFNDVDMMCVGIHGTGKSSSDLVVTPGMTMTEYTTQFAMWCMWGSPLTLSFDLRENISAEDLALITNPELIAINQDRMGQAAEFVYEDGNQCQLYFKDLENGDVAVAVLNLSDSQQSFDIDFRDISALSASEVYSVRDLVNREDLDPATGSMQVNNIQAHETRVFRLTNAELMGLGSVEANEVKEMVVTDLDSKLRVTLPGSEGLAKRVMISDVEGRVLTAETSASETIELTRPNGPQTVVVNLVCAGKAHTSKIFLR